MRTRKPTIPQFEFGFTSQTFNLAGEQTADGARIQAKAEQSARDRAESEARQTTIPRAHYQTIRAGDPHAKPGTLIDVKTEGFTNRAEVSLAFWADKITASERDMFNARIDAERQAKKAEANLETVPGLRPGSSWTVDKGMRKALATMQGGGL